MKICFFGNISPTIKGKTIGGGELQIYLLAKALALKGHQVIIIDPYSDKSFTTPEGIKLINIPNWYTGIKGLRMFTRRIPILKKMFAEQNADYYYVRMRSYIHLIPYIKAKKNGGKFIQAISSDVDVLSDAKKYTYEYKSNFNILRFLTEDLPNDIVFRRLLKLADYVMLQHSGQKFKSSSLKSKQVIFPNIIDLDTLPVSNSTSQNYFIYAGSLTMLKGADRLLDLIKIIDSSITIMIVGSPKGKIVKKIYEELGKKKNVILMGQKNQKETLELISNARALINTSYYEGFPNIFLEAWGTGVPVISLSVNPGGIFDKFKLGIYCHNDLNRMKVSIETSETDKYSKEELIAYVEKFHDFKTAADRFLNAITLKILIYFPVAFYLKYIIAMENINQFLA